MGPPEGNPAPAHLLQTFLALAGVFASGSPPRVVPALADLRESVSAPDLLIIKDGARIRGDVEAPRVVAGHRVRIDGRLRTGSLRAGRELSVAGKLEVAGRASFQGGLHVEPVAPSPAHSSPVILSGVRIDVPTRQADRLLAAFRAVGWGARDTGRTVSTDEEEDGLTTLLVDVRVPAEGIAERAERAGLAESAEPAERAEPAENGEAKTTGSLRAGKAGSEVDRSPASAPFVRGAVLALGDLVVGEGVEMEQDLAATGSVTVLPGALLSGRVRAGGDLRVGEGAVVGDATCGGRLHLAPDARVTGAVEADGGLAPGTRRPAP